VPLRRWDAWRHAVRWPLDLALGAVLVAISSEARAADPQTYTVSIADTGDSALNKALSEASELQSLKDNVPVGPFALITRAREDKTRWETVLQSFGYYDGKATVTIDGRPLDDPGLTAQLETVPSGTAVPVVTSIDKGPLFHLRNVVIEGDVPPDVRRQLGLEPGQPAVASDVLAAGTKLLTALEEDGYALAKVDPPIAIEVPAAQALDITFKVNEGRRATIGAIIFSGLKEVNEDFVRRRLLLQSGVLYQPSKVEAARLDLLSLGVFSGITARAGEQIAPDGTIPITFDFQERPSHAVGFTGAFSTDLGLSLGTNWSDRNLFGNAEQLNLSAAGTGLGGTASTGLGYNITAQFIKPDFLRRDQSFELDITGLKQDLEAYRQQAVTFGPSIHRKLSPLWNISVGITAEQERIQQENVGRTYTLVALPVTAKFDSTGLTDPLTDPTHGIRGAVTATPTQSITGKNATFAILQGSAATYFDLGHLFWHAEAGRSVLALRALIGSVEGAGQFDIPPDQRFYGGGSATVRGFKYQSVGPLFPDRNPMGGTSIDAGTIEYRQRLFGDFGSAFFIDAGQVSAERRPFSGTLRVGTGFGVRYYTPIGPVRLDLAVPVNRPPGGDRFEFYIGLGQAF
jgi:translocation and assembly module TamA